MEYQLVEILNAVDWEEVNRVTQQKADRIHKLVTENQKKKFGKLQQSVLQSMVSPPIDLKKVIVNLTGEEVDEPTKSVLLKGLNFAVAPKRIPTEDIICAVESAIKDLPPDQSEEVRQDVAVVLRKAKPPKANLTREERVALKNLKEDETKVVLPADKGNATVIMKTEQYKEKIKNMLTEGPYKVIRNPTRKITAAVSQLVKTSLEPDGKLKHFLVNSDPRPPLLYGLPKVHKDNIPMCPIVSSIGSPTYNLAKFISRQLAQHVGKTASFVKDSRHFINYIGELNLEESDMLVSFDVESLFTKVPVPDTVDIIKEVLSPELSELAGLCLRSTYFLFDGNFYEQTEGAAMGSPLSPVAANLYMERFESMALETAELKPKKWLRYVDDVWAVWPHGKECLNGFLAHLNSIHSNIKFTMEVEENKKLPFLDVLTKRKADGTIGHAVYRKPTHTNRYLNASSHHHPAQKNGILNTLINRAIHISDESSWTKEKDELWMTLKQNGYKDSDIKRAFRNQLSRINDARPRNEQLEESKRAFLPYVKGTTDRIGRILKRHQINTVFKPAIKVRNLLRSVKDSIPLCTPGVYEIPCSCGSVYIGETKRLISTRVKEHIRHTKYEDTGKSAVAEQSQMMKHGIKFDEAKVLAKIPQYYPRIVREAIEIRKRKDNFNKDDSLRLSHSWKPVLKNL